MSNRLALCMAIVLFAAAAGALAQSTDRSWPRLFGGSSAKTTPAKPPAEDARRLTEIGVELAWLADPLTFPYFLEARVEGSTLVVRGFVPDKPVREQALRLARLHSSYTVTDSMKEHPSLVVRPGQMSPPQLQSAVVSSLKEVLPKNYQQLQVQCAADGKVSLRGSVGSAEQKLAASQALRRLYGCTSVQNLIQVPAPADAAQAKAPAPAKASPKEESPKQPPAAAKAEPSETPRPTFGPPIIHKDAAGAAKAEKKPTEAKAVAQKAGETEKPPSQAPDPVQGPSLFPTKDPPSAKVGEPVKDPPATAAPPPAAPPPAAPPPPAETPPPKAAPKPPTPAMIAKMQKKVLEACPGAKDVKIELAKSGKLRIDLTVRTEEQIGTFAGNIFNVAELTDYRDEIEMHFTLEEEKGSTKDNKDMK
jgi:hypothetical protein